MIAQFCCTSLWFAGNGVMGDLAVNFNLQANALGHLTSAVQFGFISGTLIFAILTIADRYSPSKVFFSCALLGAIFNAALVWEGNSLSTILCIRFMTGFFLSGIYPVGMKIATDYFEKGLGKSLGFLVGALVLGTAFPHLAKELTDTLPWKSVLFITSSLAVLGGFLMFLLVPDGPYRKAGSKLDLSAFFDVFKNHKFRAAAFGYFGHMWELYAFWVFVPVILKLYASTHSNATINISLWSFLIIGVGGLACVLGGYLAQAKGTKKIAKTALLLSCVCCLLSPIFFMIKSEEIFLCFLVFWGMVVIADSPLFSTLVAQNAEAEIKGTALTIVNCIGFLITIFSIELLTLLQNSMNQNYMFVLLAIGPILGLIALRSSLNATR